MTLETILTSLVAVLVKAGAIKSGFSGEIKITFYRGQPSGRLKISKTVTLKE